MEMCSFLGQPVGYSLFGWPQVALIAAFSTRTVISSLSNTAWCLKNESVHCVVLGASNVDQLYEDMRAIQVCRLHAVTLFTAQVHTARLTRVI